MQDKFIHLIIDTLVVCFSQHLLNALKNLDWLVKYDEIMMGDARALSFVSTAGEDLGVSNKTNICTWRSQKCFLQVYSFCGTSKAKGCISSGVKPMLVPSEHGSM